MTMAAIITLFCGGMCVLNGCITLARAHWKGDGLMEIQGLAWLILGAVLVK